MSETPERMFQLNGVDYDGNQLSAEGQRLLGSLTEAQNELARLEKHKELLQVAQQHLINQLKPLLPSPVASQASGQMGILGHASDTIPTTSTENKEVDSVPLPQNVPDALLAKS